MFFEVRTKRLTVTERNAYKTVKELWLFQVESYTEAEARVTEFMNKQFKGEDFSIPKIQPSKIQRVEKTDGCANEDPFYKVKIELLSENDKGKVVKEPFFILVRAESPEAAIKVGNGVGDEEAPSSETVSATKTKFTGVVVMKKKPKTAVDKKPAEAAPKKEPAKPKAEAPKEEEQPKTPAKAAKSKKK